MSQFTVYLTKGGGESFNADLFSWVVNESGALIIYPERNANPMGPDEAAYAPGSWRKVERNYG